MLAMVNVVHASQLPDHIDNSAPLDAIKRPKPDEFRDTQHHEQAVDDYQNSFNDTNIKSQQSISATRFGSLWKSKLNSTISIQFGNLPEPRNCSAKFDYLIAMLCDYKGSSYLALGLFEDFFNNLGLQDGFAHIMSQKNSEFRFNQSITMFDTFGSFVNFVSPTSKLFLESAYYRSFHQGIFDRPRPYLITSPSESNSSEAAGNLPDEEEGPKIVWGASLGSSVHILVEHSGTKDRHFKIFKRLSSTRFMYFFELSNEFNNMFDQWTPVKQTQNWTIASADMVYDQATNEEYTYIITKPENSQKNHYVINQVRVPAFKDILPYKFSKVAQSQYHKQWPRDSNSTTHNCADNVKATQKLLILTCRETSAITVYRRYKQPYGINMTNPIIDVMLDGFDTRLGQDIAVIEHVNETEQYGYSTTYLFISQEPKVSNANEAYNNNERNQAKVLAWEFVIPNNESYIQDHDHILAARIDGLAKAFSDRVWNQKNFGSQIRLSAGRNHLLMNYFNFDRFENYMFCGSHAFLNISLSTGPFCQPIGNHKFVNLGFATKSWQSMSAAQRHKAQVNDSYNLIQLMRIVEDKKTLITEKENVLTLTSGELITSCNYDLIMNERNFTSLQVTKLRFLCRYSNVGANYPDEIDTTLPSRPDYLDPHVNIISKSFLGEYWPSLLAGTIGAFVLTCSLVYMFKRIRKTGMCCFGRRRYVIPDYDELYQLYLAGEEIDICWQLAVIYDEDIRKKRQEELIGLLFESLEQRPYISYKKQMTHLDSANIKTFLAKKAAVEKNAELKTPRDLDASMKDYNTSASRNRHRDSSLMKLNSGATNMESENNVKATRDSSSGSGFLSAQLQNKYASNRELVESCCICCDDFAEDSTVVCLPCMHIYHVTCLKYWVNTRLDANMDYMQDVLQHPDCPSCRQKLTIKKNQSNEQDADLQADLPEEQNSADPRGFELDSAEVEMMENGSRRSSQIYKSEVEEPNRDHQLGSVDQSEPREDQKDDEKKEKIFQSVSNLKSFAQDEKDAVEVVSDSDNIREIDETKRCSLALQQDTVQDQNENNELDDTVKEEDNYSDE